MASCSSPDEPRDEEQTQPSIKECLYKTKAIQFLGRSTPIVLQNDNGPCPLLAICNVLLLRNNLNLSPDISEVSQEKLLSLVAERLIDSNSNVNDKDAGYLKNQQQNISDAIDLLPRLATGIDVNIKFRRIDDFEFTPECAIFDLLDIPLYHGWIVDSQDYDTANAIGVKSYNALTGELVALETRIMENNKQNSGAENCTVDFMAATTATLRVPSPSLSKARSFDESPHSVFDQQSLRKGDLEEEAELLRVLKLSEADAKVLESDPSVDNKSGGTLSFNSDENARIKGVVPVEPADNSEKSTSSENNIQPESSISDNGNALGCDRNEQLKVSPEVDPTSSLKNDEGSVLDQPVHVKPENSIPFGNAIEKSNHDKAAQIESTDPLSPVKNTVSLDENHINVSGLDAKVQPQSTSLTDVHESIDAPSGCDATGLSPSSPQNADLDSYSSRIQRADAPDVLTSNADGDEPIYEGEECVMDRVTVALEDHEPVYEGEAILAEQVDKSTSETSDVRPEGGITPQEGELIRNFLKNNASQLTIYGLFCLQEGLKERELCVFFRNNHFSTMFKFESELYLLATDQGYINQPDLVWEKLNEVNGDTVFMTSNFKEFKLESHTMSTWNEHNAVASTADYLASIDSSAHAAVDINSDLQLAIALQQQELEQQPQRQHSQQSSVSGGSGLVTGPQVSRNTGRQSTAYTRQESKSKDSKCVVM